MEYGLYLAVVIKIASNDSRLRIKILPQMDGILDDDCPLWPFFFKDEMIIPQIGEMVWVICDNEFYNGYILGPANVTTYMDEEYTPYSLSKNLKNTINNTFVNLKASKFNFANLKILYWDKNCIHMIDRSTGNVIYAYDTGSIYVFGPKEFRISIGESFLKMDTNGINFQSPSINLQSASVNLGLNPNNNVLTSLATGGLNSTTSKYVKA